MMAENTSDMAFSKGKKKCSYSMEFKRQAVVYAEANSNKSAASHFDVEPKRVREWKKDSEKIKSTKPNRQRLDGGGRKYIDENIEEDLIRWKAKSIFDKKIENLAIKDLFGASRGWCEKFMQRHGLSLRRKTTTAQKDPSYMVDRIAAYMIHVCRI